MGDMNLTVSVLLPTKNPEKTADAIKAFIADVTEVYEPWLHGNRGGDAGQNARWWRTVKRYHPLTFAFLNWRLDGKATQTHPGELVSMMSWTGCAESQQFEVDSTYELLFSTNCHSWAETDFLKCYLRMHFGVHPRIWEDQTLRQFKANRKRRIERRKREEEKRQAANA